MTSVEANIWRRACALQSPDAGLTWFKSDITTRLKPGAKILLIMKRWHPGDLGGRLLAHAPAEWRVPRLPALAEADDSLGRMPGALLWPAWEDAAALSRKRELVGEYACSALYQQTPLPPDGQLLSANRITIVNPSAIQGSEKSVRAGIWLRRLSQPAMSPIEPSV